MHTDVHRQMSKLVRVGQLWTQHSHRGLSLAYLEALHSTPVPDKEVMNNFQLNKVRLTKEKLELEVT